jgi:hypothetical protein
MRPYVASSKSMPGRKAAGGIAVRRLDRRGANTPHARPKGQPQIKPHSNTGICIGRKMLPAFGIE